jgi:hypothetical protein
MKNKEKNIRYFLATGELFLALIKKENTNLPKDAKLLKVELQPPLYEPVNGNLFNMLRFLIESDEYSPVNEGEIIPRIDIKLCK